MCLVQEASLLFADSSVHREVTEWLLSSIVKKFVDAGYAKLALAFIRTTHMPMMTAEDIELRLTVLLANG